MSAPAKNQTRRRKIWRILALVGLVLSIIAATLTIIDLGSQITKNLFELIKPCSAGDKPISTSPSSAIVVEERIIQVPANIFWNDTGIKVQTGDWIEFTANGSWWNGISTTGPDGDGGGFCGLGRPACGLCPATDGNLGELVGKVSNGLPFRIGGSALQVIDQGGSLLLAMNDNTGPCVDKRIGSCYDDNYGALDVKVTIRRIGAG